MFFSAKEVKKSFTDAILAFGGIDILINNAGKSFICNGIAACPEDVLRDSMNINFFGQQNCAAVATEIMKKQGGGVLLL